MIDLLLHRRLTGVINGVLVDLLSVYGWGLWTQLAPKGGA